MSVFHLYVKIPEALSPIARFSKYEDPIDAMLEKAGAGSVTGGGTMFAGQVEYCGIDIEVNDSKIVEEIITLLQGLGSPKGTVVEMEDDAGQPSTRPVWL